MHCRNSIALALTFCAVVFLMARPASAVNDHKMKSTAWMFGPTTLKGFIKYDDQTRHGQVEQRVRIHITRGEPNTEYPVTINDVFIGMIQTNPGGTAKMVFRTTPTKPGDQSLPFGFPRLDTGNVATIGDTSGIFFNQRDQDVQRVAVEGDSFGEGGFHTHVRYEERLKKGKLNRTFTVVVTGATPGETFDVFINGGHVGTVTIDEFGQGELRLQDKADAASPMPESFPSLHDGDVVQVGALFITLFTAVEET